MTIMCSLHAHLATTFWMIWVVLDVRKLWSKHHTEIVHVNTLYTVHSLAGVFSSAKHNTWTQLNVSFFCLKNPKHVTLVFNVLHLRNIVWTCVCSVAKALSLAQIASGMVLYWLSFHDMLEKDTRCIESHYMTCWKTLYWLSVQYDTLEDIH